MKTKYTATNKRARYTGNHPHIKDTIGVYYWNNEQGSFLYRPDAQDATKTDWYRVHRENIVDLE